MSGFSPFSTCILKNFEWGTVNILSDVFNLHILAECFTYNNNYNPLLFAALFRLVFGLPVSLNNIFLLCLVSVRL